MNKFSKIIKILIAALLVGAIIFFGVRYYLEQKAIKERDEAAIMDMIIKNADNESEVVTLKEVKDEEKINRITEYIPNIYLDFQGSMPLPEFTEIKYLDDEYILQLAYLAEPEVKKEPDENGMVYYTYPELNRTVVKYLGKSAHNRLPDKTTYYFEKSTAGFTPIGMGGSEIISYKYIIDKFNVGSNGLYYIDIYEYKIESETTSADLDEAGEKMSVAVKNIEDEKIFEYYMEAVPYDEASLRVISYNLEGKEISDEDIEESVKDNINKFNKRTLVIEYDEELDLFYLKSNSIEK